MGTEPVQTSLYSHSTDANFRQKKNSLILRVLIISSVVIYILETI